MADLIERRDALNMHFSHGINNDGVLYVPFREVMDNLKALPSEQTTQNNRVNSDIALDLIERQAAIDEIYNVYDKYDRNAKVEELASAIQWLPSAQPEPQWIPCSERLPEEGMNCLVCDKGSVAIDTFIGHGNPYNWKWYVRDYEAWMPLPEPWRGEENG